MHHALEQYARLIPFLGETLGELFAACLFDLTEPACPAAACVNLSAGGQKRLRAYLTQIMNSQRVQTKGCWTNAAIEGDEDSLMKASVFLIRDDGGEAVGALCLGMRCEFLMRANGLLAGLLQFNTEDPGDEEAETPPARELSLDLIDEMVAEFGVEPGRVSPGERSDIICDLYDEGVFELKGAVARAADALGVSVQSIYRYLAKIKRARQL